jgi:hypothetical protein
VTASVMVCSTCRRGLASMKTKGSVGCWPVDQEFEGAQALVAARRAPWRSAASVISWSQAGFSDGAGRDLHQLLEAALQRAFALAQRHHAALAVAQQLHLDVAGAGISRST